MGDDAVGHHMQHISLKQIYMVLVVEGEISQQTNLFHHNFGVLLHFKIVDYEFGDVFVDHHKCLYVRVLAETVDGVDTAHQHMGVVLREVDQLHDEVSDLLFME